MKEYQVVVTEISNKVKFYTLQVRKVGLFFKGKWRDVYPAMQPTYDDAIKLKT